MNSMQDSPPGPVSSIPVAETPKRWRVGTLEYTAGGLAVLFFWLLWGDFAWSLKERAIPSVLQLLLKKHGASDMLTGLLISSVPGILGLVLAPVISYRSDRHRGKWGRRVPYLILTIPIAVFSMIGLAFAPQLGTGLHQLFGEAFSDPDVLVVVFFGVFWGFFEVSSIAANAVFGGLINDVVPEPVLGRFYGAFRALSLLAAICFNYWLLGIAEKHFFANFLGLAALYGFGFTAMLLKVREGCYPPPPSEEASSGVVEGFWKAAKGYCRECFGRSYYVWFFLAMSFSWVAIAAPTLFGVYFAKAIQMSMADFGKCLALTYAISLGLAWPLGMLADKIHPLRLGLGAQLLFAGITLWGGIFARDIATFSFAMVAQGVLAGTWMTVTASLNQRLLPKAKFAQYASASALVASVGTIMIGPLLGKYLDITGHIYRHVFLVSFLLMGLSITCGLVVHRRFISLGGPRHYVAPQ